jgi:hypothetical protein
MRIINFNIIECTQLKNNNKSFHTLLFKEQFKYLKTSHSYHLVDPSPWTFSSIWRVYGYL